MDFVVEYLDETNFSDETEMECASVTNNTITASEPSLFDSTSVSDVMVDLPPKNAPSSSSTSNTLKNNSERLKKRKGTSQSDMSKLIHLVEQSSTVLNRLVTLEEERRQDEVETSQRDSVLNSAMLEFLNAQTRLAENQLRESQHK